MENNPIYIYVYICITEYICNWITLLYTWNTLNQLHFNKKKVKQVQLLKEICCDVTDLDKPVNGAAVHKGWKHPASGPEGLPNGAHAEHNVQLLTDSADEILKHLTKR